MPRLNWDSIPDNDGFPPLPEGIYLAEIYKVDESRTNRGDDMWILWFKVIEPKEYAGWKFPDFLSFSEAAMPRVKLICHRLGIVTKGEVELTPSALKGRQARVSVYIDEREGKRRNKVPYAGYESVDQGIGKRIEEIANAPGSALAKAAESEEAPF